jgi:hypothetical protein
MKLNHVANNILLWWNFRVLHCAERGPSALTSSLPTAPAGSRQRSVNRGKPGSTPLPRTDEEALGTGGICADGLTAQPSAQWTATQMWRCSLLLRRRPPCRGLTLGKEVILPRVPACRRPGRRQRMYCREYFCAERDARQRNSLPRAR